MKKNVISAQNGDNAAFTVLVGEYRQMVYGVCYRMTGDADAADDLAHETFVEAFIKLYQLRDPERFGGWLRTLALNLCRMWLRSRKLIEVELHEELVAECPVAPEAMPDNLSRGLLQLNAPQRLVLVLNFIEGLSYDDVATFLNIPVGTVMSRLHRGRKELKRIVQEMQEEEIPMEPKEDFTREVDAEIAVLLRMFQCEPGAAERLSIILAHAPERLEQLIAEADDEDTLKKLALLLRRLGRPAIEIVLNCALLGDDSLRQRATGTLCAFVARQGDGVTGQPPWYATSPFMVYTLLDGLTRSSAEAARKAELLVALLENSPESATITLLANVLLCYPQTALPALLSRFWGAATVSIPVLAALARMGTVFVAELLEPLATGDTATKLRALNGLAGVGRSLGTQYLFDPVQAMRNAEKWAPIPAAYLDEAVLLAAVQSVSNLLDAENREVCEAALNVLGQLRMKECTTKLKEWICNGEGHSRVAALRALAETIGPDTVEVFLLIAQRGSMKAERMVAIPALGRMQCTEAVPMLLGLLADDDAQVRQLAAVALGDIGGEGVEEALRALITGEDKPLARTAAKALATSPHFKKVRKPNVALQQLSREVKTRLVGEHRPQAFISLHTAIAALPEIRPYPEREITRIIATACIDYSTTRRALIMEKLMQRHTGIYELTDLGQAIWRVERVINEGYLR